MRERPILFSAPMVRAILAGAKTQTRRVIKPQPHEDFGALEVGLYHPTIVDRHGEEQPGPEQFGAWTHDGECSWRCPYGQPGDRLWVRETFREDKRFTCPPAIPRGPILYRADPRSIEADRNFNWSPSSRMPRWASRIDLEVTGVRVERLQGISANDAAAEGVSDWMVGPTSPQQDFHKLWESINGPGSWGANPWVWVVEFRRVKP